MLSTTFAIRRAVPGLALLFGVLLLAAEALAQNTYTVNSAFWVRNSGRFTNVPFVGNTINNCPDTLVPRINTSTQTGGTGATPAVSPAMTLGSAPQAAAPHGCPRGPVSGGPSTFTATTANATVNGAGGAFTLPANLITRPAYGMLVTVNLPYASNILQASTDGIWYIPPAKRYFSGTSAIMTTGGLFTDAIGAMVVPGAVFGPSTIGPVGRLPSMCTESTCTNLAQFRTFQQSHYKGGPGASDNVSGRAGASFTWCFGQGNAGTVNMATPAGCTTINQLTNPTATNNKMLVRYQAGPRAFGGTSAQLTRTSIEGRLFIQPFATVVSVQRLKSDPAQIQVQGRGYADFLTDSLEFNMTAFTNYGFATGGMFVVNGPGGTFTIPSKITSLGMTTANLLPDAVNSNYGFPLTTGTVLVRRIDMTPLVVTITGRGMDTATSMGARNISLVTGALSNLSSLAANTATFSRLTLNLPEPGGLGGLAAGAVALLGMAAWRARKTR